MTGPSAKAEQALRRDVLRNDQQSNLRPGDYEPSTMHEMSRLSNDLEGRHSARDYLSGSAQATDYPAIPSGPWSSDYARVPDEPPLGFDMNAVEPTGTPAEVAASIVALCLPLLRLQLRMWWQARLGALRQPHLLNW